MSSDCRICLETDLTPNHSSAVILTQRHTQFSLWDYHGDVIPHAQRRRFVGFCAALPHRILRPVRPSLVNRHDAKSNMEDIRIAGSVLRRPG